jgi:hypothetical protein
MKGGMSCSVRDGAYLTRQLATYSGRDHCGRRIGHTLYVHQTPWPDIGFWPGCAADIVPLHHRLWHRERVPPLRVDVLMV